MRVPRWAADTESINCKDNCGHNYKTSWNYNCDKVDINTNHLDFIVDLVDLLVFFNLYQIFIVVEVRPCQYQPKHGTAATVQGDIKKEKVIVFYKEN